MTLWEKPPWFLLVAISVIWHYLSILHELAKLWKDGNVSFFLGKIWPIATWLVLADLVLYLAVRRHFCDLVGMNWAGGDSDKTLAGPYYGAGVWDRELGWGCVFVCVCWGGGHHKIDSVLIFTLPHENWVPDELEHWMSCKDGRSAQREVSPNFYGFSTQNLNSRV